MAIPAPPLQHFPSQSIKVVGARILWSKEQRPGQRHLLAIKSRIHGTQPSLGITTEPSHQGLVGLHLAGAGTGELDPRKVTA
jgi:hypothetical protein